MSLVNPPVVRKGLWQTSSTTGLRSPGNLFPALIVHDDAFGNTPEGCNQTIFCYLMKLEGKQQGGTSNDAIDRTCLHGQIDITEGNEHRFCSQGFNVVGLMTAGRLTLRPLTSSRVRTGFFVHRKAWMHPFSSTIFTSGNS